MGTEKIGPQDALADVGHHKSPLEQSVLQAEAERLGAVGLDGGTISRDERRTAAFGRSVGGGGWNKGNISPTVHEETEFGDRIRDEQGGGRGGDRPWGTGRPRS